MPLERCGNNGWRYGKSGKCYTGKDAKKKAIRQGVAEQYNGGEKFQGSEATQAEIDEALHDEPYHVRLAFYRQSSG
jgi:hypothetical protein